MNTASTSSTKVSIGGFKVSGVVTCTPSNVVSNSHFYEKFGEAGVKDVVKLIGVEERRWCDQATSTADLCLHAGNRLLEKLKWDPSTVDAVIFLSQTPNWRLPATACWLQTSFGLNTCALAFDVNLGCSGYPYALWLGASLLKANKLKRILLAVGDTISKVIDPDDRATALLFGDAGSVTAIEHAENQPDTAFVLGSDGNGWDKLIVPVGGFKYSDKFGGAQGVNRKLDALYMDGGEIFNFTLRSVPRLVEDTLFASETSVEDYDGFLFHQANLFMLKHLAKKSKVPTGKLLINIDKFGNTSSASIPLLMTNELGLGVDGDSKRLMLCGFGVGYSWASTSLILGPKAYLEHVDYE